MGQFEVLPLLRSPVRIVQVYLQGGLMRAKTMKIVLICTCLLALLGCAKAPSPGEQRIAPGDMAPTFVLEDMESNEQINFTKTLQNSNAAVLIIWSMACPSCRQALVDCQEVYETYAPHGVSFLSLNFDQENLHGVRAFLRGEDIEYNTLWDRGARVARAYKAMDYTFSIFVVDRDRLVRLSQYDHPPDLATILSKKLDQMLGLPSSRTPPQRQE
jgi:peroxiredoxin